jgi:hypothetical protein
MMVGMVQVVVVMGPVEAHLLVSQLSIVGLLYVIDESLSTYARRLRKAPASPNHFN